MSQEQLKHLMPNYGERTLTMISGAGMYLHADNGRAYLDFAGGIAVCSLGHSHPAVTETIRRQAGTLLHCSNLFVIPQQVTVADRLAAISGLQRAFFCNSGTEANEAAIKLARKYAVSTGASDKKRIVSLPGAFHGRTFGSLSITPKPAYQEGYDPLVPGCVSPTEMESVVAAIDEDTAACVVEIIQGEGGMRPVPVDILRAIEAKCRDVGALLIVDEVQTGVGRTGTFFAYQQVGIDPDIVTMAKGLGNGIPVGAVLAKETIALAFTPGSHGSTFGGNPFAMSVAATVIDVVSDESFLKHVNEVGQYLSEKLHRLGEGISGRGLMWGMTVSNAKDYVRRAADAGVLLASAGERRVRFVPPLIVEKHDIDELYLRLSDVRV